MVKLTYNLFGIYIEGEKHMKRVISFILSIVMLFSIVGAVDLSACAAEGSTYLSEEDIQFLTSKFSYTLTQSEKAMYADHLKNLNPEIEWSATDWDIVKYYCDNIQKVWGAAGLLLPDKITENELAKLGNNTLTYISSSIEVFKNIHYISETDGNNIQKAYHGIKAFQSVCNILGWSLGSFGIVLSAVAATLPIADLLYKGNIRESLDFYEGQLQIAYYTNNGEELPKPDEAMMKPAFANYLGQEQFEQGLYSLYIYYSLKLVDDKINNMTFVNPIGEKCNFAGHTYQVFDISKNWTQAKEYCENLGGHLVTITDSEEQSFVSNLVKRGNKDTYWLGATDVEVEGEWKWITGEPFEYQNGSFDNGPPGPEDWLEMIASSGRWNDGEHDGDSGIYSLQNHGFVCEWDNYIDPFPTMNDEHHYSQTVIAPTCTADGYTINKCTDCELEYYSNNVTKLGHNYSFSKTVTPTCTAQGYDLYTCTRCNNTEKRNTVSAKGHDYQYQKTVAPTCSSQGYDTYKCTRCTSTENRNKISAKGHSYSFTKTVAPTCTAQGYDLYTCSTCSATEKRNTVSSTGHNYEVISNTATCTEKGIKTSKCTVCGNTTTAEVSSLGHSYRKVYTVPTCTEDGGYTNTCTRCGDITHSIYEAKGHDYGNLIGKDYIDKISGSSISTAPNYFNQYYHTSSSIGSNSNATLTSTNMAVPNEIRLDINDIAEVKNYQFAIKGSLFSRKNCSAVFAYDKTTGRTPEQSAIPYTDKDGNLIDFTYVDYKVNGNWQRGHYKLDDNNQIIDLDGNVVCSKFEQTRTHIHYTKQEALDLGFMYNDGTINAVDVFEKYEGVWFSAGIPGVYFTADNISPPMNARRFIDVFGYDKTISNSIKPGKYDVDLCFYNPTYSGLSSTTFKIYDDSLINKTPATVSTDEKVTYTCMDCGETHTDTCKLNIADFKIKTISLSLESSITMNFKVLKSAVADFKNPYVVFNCEGDELTVTDYSEQGDYYVFSYLGISPQLMNDDVKAVLHATHNGIDYTSPEKVMSVRTYAYTMIDRYSSDDYAELRTLLVDLLNYGAASQKYIGYQTDNLVNADLTDEQKSWGTSTAPTFENIRDYDYKTIANPTSKWIGSGLVLNNSVMVRAKFTADSIENKTVKITCGKGEFTYTKDDFVQDKDGNYYVYCNEIFANEMSEEILLTVYDNGVPCSNTMRFSIESYAKLVHDSYKGTALDELTTAMMRYGNSAKAYGA